MERPTETVERAALILRFSGVVSAFRGSTPLLSKAFGWRDAKNAMPNTTSTLFGIASGSKFVTALGIGVLIDGGLLSLDTAVGKIGREYSGFIDPQATILHLLTHTSGIYDYCDQQGEHGVVYPPVEIPLYKLETPSDYFPVFRDKPMKHRPGKRYSYSNGGYVLLGMLIERLTGRLYRDFVSEHVLEVAGMKRSGFHAFNDLPPDTAEGYLDDRRTTNIYHLPIRGGGDGGFYVTTDDLRRLWDGFLSRRILSEALTTTYLQTHCVLSDMAGYGCGILKRLDDSVFMLEGVDIGVGFSSQYFVESGLIVNTLSNITDGATDMRDAFIRCLGDLPPLPTW